MGRVRQASPAQRRHAAAVRRDVALARLSSVTGAIGIATIAAVGILGVYVGKALPGHHATTPAATGTASSRTSGGAASGTGGNSGQGSLNPPSTPTQSAPAPAPVTSGSS